VISTRVGLDWHSKNYLLNIAALTAESQCFVVVQGLNDVVTSLELLSPDNKVEWFLR